MAKVHDVLLAAADMFVASQRLREFDHDSIRAAVKLLKESNPVLVTWVLYTLAYIVDEEPLESDATKT